MTAEIIPFPTKRTTGTTLAVRVQEESAESIAGRLYTEAAKSAIEFIKNQVGEKYGSLTSEERFIAVTRLTVDIFDAALKKAAGDHQKAIAFLAAQTKQRDKS